MTGMIWMNYKEILHRNITRNYMQRGLECILPLRGASNVFHDYLVLHLKQEAGYGEALMADVSASWQTRPLQMDIATGCMREQIEQRQDHISATVVAPNPLSRGIKDSVEPSPKSEHMISNAAPHMHE